MDDVSRNLEDESNDIHEPDFVINNLSYRNRIDINSLLDYPGQNDGCLEV